MGILAFNNLSDYGNKINVELYGEHIANGVFVAKVLKTVTVPPRSVLSWHKLLLVADADGGNSDVEVLPLAQSSSRALSRVIGTWGTQTDSPGLIMQEQEDRMVTFSGDHRFQPDFDIPGGFGGDSKWHNKGAPGAWPPGLAVGVYVRAEARAMVDGFAQLNLGSRAVDGQTNQPGTHMRTQIKGFTEPNEPQASVDRLYVPLMPPGDDVISWMCKSETRGNILFSGYRLRST